MEAELEASALAHSEYEVYAWYSLFCNPVLLQFLHLQSSESNA